jgi:hypothetical protein
MTACSGGGSFVKGANLTTSQQNGQDYVKLSTQLNAGSIVILPVALPVYNPHNPSEQIGSISVSGSELDVNLNLSAVLSLPDDTVNGTLPNGTTIPVAGVSSQNWISLPVANGKSIVYLNFDVQNKKVALGAAVSIDQLSIGIPAALLVPFSFTGVSGVAGVYTGVSKGQSGFAVFADASGLLNSASGLAFMQKKTADAQIQQKLYQLNSSRAKLKAQ